MTLLTEKYRPKTLNELVGNIKAINELREWLGLWNARDTKNKGLIISGPPGVGKTSAAMALALESGCDPIEMNASDKRNYGNVKNIAMRGAMNRTFGDDGVYVPERKKVIILDEADSLSGKEDFGGVRAIVETLRDGRQPVILIANDAYALTSRSRALKSYCRTVRFNRPRKDEIYRLLRKIREGENLNMSDQDLHDISEVCNGDIRSAINDLGVWGTAAYRERARDVFSILPKIFAGGDHKLIKSQLRGVNIEPRDLLLWVDENAPRVFEGDTLARVYDMVSRSDIYSSRAMRTRNFRLWRYATDLLILGPVFGERARRTRYFFPTWLKEMSSYKGNRTKREEVCLKLGAVCHTSKRKVKTEVLPYLRFLLERDDLFAINALEILDEGEVAFLVGEKRNNEIMGARERLRKTKSLGINGF